RRHQGRPGVGAPAGRRRGGRLRPAPHRAHPAQPRGERDRARRGAARRGDRRRGRPCGGRRRARLRRRHDAAGGGARVRQVLARRPGAGAHHRRLRARPGDRARGRAPARGQARRVGQAGPGRELPAHAAAQRRCAGRRAADPARAALARPGPADGPGAGRPPRRRADADRDPRPVRARPPGGGALMRRLVRRGAAAVVALAVAATLGACAQIPMSGPVRVGNADVDPPADIAMLPQGPAVGATPRQIVSGFLGAAVAATTSPEEFETAREYLTEEVASTWEPASAVRVVRETPVAEPVGRGDQVDLAEAETVDMVVRATTIATLDTSGAYSEVGNPRELGYRFTLVRVGGEWRISVLDDGVLVPANLFANQYRATRLYFPSATDTKYLVPD